MSPSGMAIGTIAEQKINQIKTKIQISQFDVTKNEKRLSSDFQTYAIEVLNGIHASRFPSCSRPYAKLCLLKVNRKGTTWTPSRRWKAIASRSKCLMPATTRTGKCEVIGNDLQWMNIDSYFWEVRESGSKWRIRPLITFISGTIILVPCATIKVQRIVFVFTLQRNEFLWIRRIHAMTVNSNFTPTHIQHIVSVLDNPVWFLQSSACACCWFRHEIEWVCNLVSLQSKSFEKLTRGWLIASLLLIGFVCGRTTIWLSICFTIEALNSPFCVAITRTLWNNFIPNVNTLTWHRILKQKSIC